MNKLLKALYDSFYEPLPMEKFKQGVEDCRRQLIERLEKPERRLVLQIIDTKDRIAEDTSLDSFVSGFELAWQLSNELNQYEKERPVSLYGEEIWHSFYIRRGERKVKRQIITAAAIAACLAPCAATWPQTESG